MQTDHVLDTADVIWHGGQLRSRRYADGYADLVDPIGESRQVFLAGNCLPARWHEAGNRGQRRFNILELGFGSGLNFLLTLADWQAFLGDRPGTLRRLSFVSIEGHPLPKSTAVEVLGSPAYSQLPFREALARHWPPPVRTSYRLHAGNGCELVVVQDRVEAALDALEPLGLRQFDAVFLDGFAPARNPSMWTRAVLTRIAKLAKPGATMSTFTVAGQVRRDLQSLGIKCRKLTGHGNKKHMLSGVFTQTAPPYRKPQALPRVQPYGGEVIVVGGGLAGSASAYCLAKRGLKVGLICAESRPPKAPSGNMLAAYFPAITSDLNPRTRFLWQAVFELQQFLATQPRIRSHRCGALFLATNAKLQTRFQHFADRLCKVFELAYLDPQAASEVAGVDVTDAGVWIADAGIVDATALCRAWQAHPRITVHPATHIHGLRKRGTHWYLDAGASRFAAARVVLACGADSKLLPAALTAFVSRVAGRLTYLRGHPNTTALRTLLCAQTYITPTLADHNLQAVGATWSAPGADVDVKRADLENLLHVQRLVSSPKVPSGANAGNWICGGMTGTRLLSRDRLPLVGPAATDDEPESSGLYLNVAHGPRGLTSSLLCGDILAATISGDVLPVTNRVARALRPSRFAKHTQAA